MKSRPVLITTLIVFAVLSRLIPHPANFTPIAAIGLFGAAHFRSKSAAYLVPLAALFVSDLLLSVLLHFNLLGGWLALGDGLHAGSPFVYASFAVVVALGMMLRNRKTPLMIGAATLAASTVFFLLSNFVVWLGFSGVMYPHTFAGLIACYTAALPFFGRTLAGDFFFVTVLFGSLALAEMKFPVLRPKTAVTT